MKASRGAAVRCGGLQVRAGGCVERVGRARADREKGLLGRNVGVQEAG